MRIDVVLEYSIDPKNQRTKQINLANSNR